MLKDKTKNQINVIYPYRTKAGWSFDDAEVGLQGEPFVMNVPEIIDSIVGKANNFEAIISKDPIPEATGVLKNIDKIKKEDIEGWYQLEGTEMIGWLCPAALRYFSTYPENIYFKISVK